MIKISQDTLMGVAVAFASLMLLVREQWFLTQTQKGQKLVTKFGPDNALWVLRAILASIMVLGVLLATGIIRPVQWGTG